jgi:hypothetical protein
VLEPSSLLEVGYWRGHARRRPQVRRDTRARRDADPRPFHFNGPLTYCFDLLTLILSSYHVAEIAARLAYTTARPQRDVPT